MKRQRKRIIYVFWLLANLGITALFFCSACLSSPIDPWASVLKASSRLPWVNNENRQGWFYCPFIIGSRIVCKKLKEEGRKIDPQGLCSTRAYLCSWYVLTGKALKGYRLPHWQGEPGEESNFWTKLVNERNRGKRLAGLPIFISLSRGFIGSWNPAGSRWAGSTELCWISPRFPGTRKPV